MYVMWMSKDDCYEESFVENVQLYSDKSGTFVKLTGLTAYFVYITIVIVSHDGWKR